MRVSRSQGDAAARQRFADAFSHDPRVDAFYRAMQTYRHAMADAGPPLVLSPESELLRYFNTGAPYGPLPPSKP